MKNKWAWSSMNTNNLFMKSNRKCFHRKALHRKNITLPHQLDPVQHKNSQVGGWGASRKMCYLMGLAPCSERTPTNWSVRSREKIMSNVHEGIDWNSKCFFIKHISTCHVSIRQIGGFKDKWFAKCSFPYCNEKKKPTLLM